MRDPLARYVVGILALILATILVLWATQAFAAEPCLEAGDRCWTVDDYDEAYADPFAEFDALEYVFGVPSEPLAAELPSVEQKRPSERLLGAGLVETLFTFAELIEQQEEAFDNPAFR